MTFTIIQNEKAPLQAIKERSSRIRKIQIFAKGLSHDFGQNMGIFPTFFFLALQVRKMTFSIVQIEKTAFQAIKTRSSKSRKIDIFPKALAHGFGPKLAIFGIFFYFILARKMTFSIFQIEKTPFYAIKTRSSKSRKIDIFTKGFTRGFGPNMAVFPTFFFGTIRQENDFYDILEEKKRLSWL